VVAIATNKGSLGIPDVLIQAVVRNAERCADIAGASLVAIFPGELVSLPKAFLLEFSAILQLGMWERQGLRQFLPADIPSFLDSARQLGQRARKGSGEFEGANAAPLSRQVLQTWIDHFAWEGPDLLQAEIVVGEVDDEDGFADLLAGFIWEHCRESSLFRADQQD